MTTLDKEKANEQLLQSLKTRRTFLAGATAGAAGLTLAGASMLSSQHVSAVSTATGMTHQIQGTTDTVASILTVAAIAEQLAVTFYTNGLAHATELGLVGASYDAMHAAQIEEQIHQQFFVANGGTPNISTFSFPDGAKTFTDLATFIKTQQTLEGVFDSAFLVAIREFCNLGHPDLAEIAGQIATVETMHLALGRYIGGLNPADNWAFSPIMLGSVGDAPALVQSAGFLSPMDGNSYSYEQVPTTDHGVTYITPYAVPYTGPMMSAPGRG